jgi:hypothetical protein
MIFLIILIIVWILGCLVFNEILSFFTKDDLCKKCKNDCDGECGIQ